MTSKWFIKHPHGEIDDAFMRDSERAVWAAWYFAAQSREKIDAFIAEKKGKGFSAVRLVVEDELREKLMEMSVDYYSRDTYALVKKRDVLALLDASDKEDSK